jgi:putative tryptophan/tyrosine transport system substrate-binding protein
MSFYIASWMKRCVKSPARVSVCVVSGLCVLAAVSAWGQDARLRRIGFVAGAGGFPKMAVTNQTFFDALSEAGYPHGKVLDVVFRTAEGDMAKMPALVQDVLRQNVEILVVSASPGCAAAKKATTTVPVLCISVQDDPVREGLTESLSKGSGNVVGVHNFLPDGIAQQLNWLVQFVPRLKTVGVLHNPVNATHTRLLTEWSSIAKQRSIEIVPMPVTTAQDLDAAINTAIEKKAQIAIGLLGADTYAIRKEIAERATARKFPIVMDTPGGYTQMGGVATVGVDIVPYYRRGALEQMVPLLKGVKPSDLAWIGPDKIDVRINRALAQSFGINIPANAAID